MSGQQSLYVFVLFLSCAGCQTTSKYAMDDPDYAEKYDEPYGDDKILRMGKQMVDARHVAGKGGISLTGGYANTGSGAAAGQIGLFTYPVSWAEYRAGLAGVYSGDADNGFGGVDLGMRFQPPSRFAPFAGWGVYGGTASKEDDCGCEDEFDGAFAAIYPEVGAHFWMTGSTRLSLSSQYWFNTQGREADFWLHTVSISLLSH